MSSFLKVIVAVFFLTTLPLQVHALTPDQIFDKVKDSIVVVKTLDAQGKLKVQGSGVLLPSGKVATNCHVVKGGASYQAGRGKQLISAILYAEDADKDICILDAKGIIGKPAQLGRGRELKVGDPVYAVGAPQGLELSLSDGIVAQLRGGPPPLIQTTVAISPGSSGGGLFDEEGKLVGLTTLYIKSGQSLNFAMPVEWIDGIKPGRKTIAEGRSQTKWLKRAIALERLKDWQTLLDWCQKWTKSEPNNTEGWYALGVAYGNHKRYNDAVDAYCQAVRINPKDAAIWNNLGAAYDDLNRPNEAVDAYRQALRINLEDADAWFGVSYYRLNHNNDKIEAYRQAVRIKPKYAEPWKKLGLSYRNLNRHSDAIDAYRQALRINSEDADAWYNLGVSYTDSGNQSAALDAVRELQHLDPERAEKLFNQIVPR